MPRRRSSKRSILTSFFGVSLLLHLQIILIAVAVVSMRPEGCVTAEDLPLSPIEVALVPSAREIEAEQRVRAQEVEEEEKKEKQEKGQVVELPRPRDERRPVDSKYLSEYDSSVERQTKAAAGRRAGGAVTRPRQRGAKRPQRAAARKPSPQPPGKLAMRARPSVPGSGLPPEPEGSAAPSRARRRASAPERLPPGALRATPQELREAIGGGTLDALMGVERGAETLLNSRRWRFASFFNRMKRQVAQNWHPGREYRRRDPAGNVYGFKDRLTILRVKLTPRGQLKTMHVEKPSGLGFLDDEAMNAFRLAQPFPNPPRGLVDDKSGLINFRFGFLFEISDRPNFRILRFRN